MECLRLLYVTYKIYRYVDTIYRDDLVDYPGRGNSCRPDPPTAMLPQWQHDLLRVVDSFSFNDTILESQDAAGEDVGADS